MGTLLESYLSFLPTKHQELIEDTRAGAVEPFSILSVIHWVAHSEMIPDKLSRLIIKEGQQILGKINPNNENITSMASLTLRPDMCRAECFGDWTDYERIQAKIPLLDVMLGKKIPLMDYPVSEEVASVKP